MRERRRLEIPEDLAEAEAVPRDLDSAQQRPYTIPSTRRRRTAGFVYLAGAAVGAVMVWVGFPLGVLVASALLAVVGAWHLVAGWRIGVLDPEALDVANRELGFPVGHASAAVGFDGWRARPVWNVLVFSADEPPSRRGLVRVDAVDGRVIEKYEEEIG